MIDPLTILFVESSYYCYQPKSFLRISNFHSLYPLWYLTLLRTDHCIQIPFSCMLSLFILRIMVRICSNCLFLFFCLQAMICSMSHWLTELIAFKFNWFQFGCLIRFMIRCFLSIRSMVIFKNTLNLWNLKKLFQMISLYFFLFQNLFLLHVVAIVSRNCFLNRIIQTLFSFQNPMLQYFFMMLSLAFTNFEAALKTSIENIGFFEYQYNKNFG